MLTVSQVEKSYGGGRGSSRSPKKVLHNISFVLENDEVLGIIGESGSGKSTLGRLLLGIEKPDKGSLHFEDRDIAERSGRRRRISAVFQDYTSSIHPYYTVEKALAEPLKLYGWKDGDIRLRIDFLLRQVGLDSSYRSKYPHELSGGEAQRVCIARAISTEPKCIVLDEAVSSLDASVQFQVLELLKELKASYGMSYIFITHDIQAAVYLCDRLMFIRDGQIEEIVSAGQLTEVRSEYASIMLHMALELAGQDEGCNAGGEKRKERIW
ncbi:dipeptide/oligopeptide/nickel ABC transporter ATP-binding protein [Paenibacillus sp. FSL R7-0337]|uniref:ABC transporter ATP-binding protein n=1 Tax=unclassified Paenibacillus TaxID=185978 RepID=UPI00096BF032|nr:dipeptide/oligopeptide/nickel ABC transporter ATP-binding protein [Paenibacillus sp. FSL R7-0337]OMF93485.1 peptide ABC transporter ATP-binding protein [Paenibacillus sp. FSL R7-0337]